jgi:hypothetical protein
MQLAYLSLIKFDGSRQKLGKTVTDSVKCPEESSVIVAELLHLIIVDDCCIE